MLARLVLTILLVLAALPAAARQLALIIGNDAYQNVEPLRKARADAEGYADFFRARGYDVHLHLDLDGLGMTEAVARFLDAIAPGDTVVFVFSGHGWSNGRENFLVPVDIRGTGSETLIQRQSYPLKNGVNGVVDDIASRQPALTVAVIDACRNNPFSFDAGTRSTGLERGLVQVRAPTGTFIAFSAGEGQTALDRLSDSDAAPHSVFTRVFLDQLSREEDLQSAFKATQRAVNDLARTVGHQQRPAYYDEVVGKACLTGSCGSGPAPIVAPAATAPVSVAPSALPNAADEWQDFRDTTSVAALRLFIARHAGTAYAALAQERIDMLERQAVAPPAQATPAPIVVPSPTQPEPMQPRTVVAPTTVRPSWCPRASTKTEVAICSDGQVAALDLYMTAVYFEATRVLGSAGRGRLQEDQRNWLAERDRCGADTACLASSYQRRIWQLEN